MRVSTLYKSERSEAPRVTRARLVIWCCIALALVTGIALYFVYARHIAPTL